MPRPRLSRADRRRSILEAAHRLFARHGYDGTRTQQIAREAGISEALVFRHFPGKDALYRAVLRQLVRDQNATFASFGAMEESADGLLRMIERTIRHGVAGAQASNANGMRIVVASLAGDADYARLVYRRARRLFLPGLARAMAAARAEGIIKGAPVAPDNAANMVEHVATMMMMARMANPPAITYAGSDEELLGDAIRFCARGIGLDPAWVEERLQAGSAAR